VFKQDDGGVNGRPHYSTVVRGGLSLYYSTSEPHRWILASVLDGGLSFASFETAGWMPVGKAIWRYHNVGSMENGRVGKMVDRVLTVESLSAAEVVDAQAVSKAESERLAFAQAERFAGLVVSGFAVGKHLPLHGVFTRDAASPEANGRPHWSTAAGGHLYYSTTGKWFLNAHEFSPDDTASHASFVTSGAVPRGEVAWQVYDDSRWVTRLLTVAELLATELAEATEVERAATVAFAVSSVEQAERCAGLQIGAIEADKYRALVGVFTRDAVSPEANGRPHWSTAAGGHLYYSTIGKWLLNAIQFTPDEVTGHASFETNGAVPEGGATWQYQDRGKWVERLLTVVELSAAEVSKVERAAVAKATATSLFPLARSTAPCHGCDAGRACNVN
jgi:hypothetical protein